MDKNIVFTLTTPNYQFTRDERKNVLLALMNLFEAFGVEVVGEITIEEFKDEKVQA